jgi:hypothetical protein
VKGEGEFARKNYLNIPPLAAKKFILCYFRLHPSAFILSWKGEQNLLLRALQWDLSHFSV